MFPPSIRAFPTLIWTCRWHKFSCLKYKAEKDLAIEKVELVLFSSLVGRQTASTLQVGAFIIKAVPSQIQWVKIVLFSSLEVLSTNCKYLTSRCVYNKNCSSQIQSDTKGTVVIFNANRLEIDVNIFKEIYVFR